jgi:Lrp/AsnC family leucine-responsive transcriptional regulator
MLETMDKKNLQILHQLDLNSRQSNSSIAKKIGLSKDAVSYRIKQLEEKGFIKGYFSIIDSGRLGYRLHRVFFNLIDMTPTVLNEFIDFLKNEKNVFRISVMDGQWDFGFVFWAKNNKDFRDFYYKHLCKKFRKYIKNSFISQITLYQPWDRSYFTKTKKTISYEIIGTEETAEYDKIDFEILKLISQNARIPLIEIANRLNLDSMTVKYRIKKLEQKEIIQGYKTEFNLALLGIDLYSIKINLSAMEKIQELQKYILNIPETNSIIETIGGFDLEFDLEVEDSKRYYQIIDELKSKFDFIREIIYFRTIYDTKMIYMPQK